MAMPDTARRYTVAEVLALPPDGNRYEVVDGKPLVTPAPRFRHQQTANRLHQALAAYLKPLGLADCVLFAPADITWGLDPDEADEFGSSPTSEIAFIHNTPDDFADVVGALGIRRD